jgi:hypothetical protein
MAYSYTTYTGDGSTTQYAVAFGYIRREHVLATVAGAPATFTFVNSTTIQMDAPPANGAVVRVYRQTPLTAPLVNFTDGSTLVAADLDTNALQSIYTQQELDDSIVEGLAGVIPNGDKGDITTSVSGTVWTVNAGLPATRSTFTQAGSGATARTVDSKLKDIVSVKDFGAVGDGTTDDTAAIQAAINWCQSNNKTLYVPNGNYRVGSLSVTEQLGIDIIGQKHGQTLDGQEGARFKYTGTGYCFNLNAGAGSTTFMYNITFKDFGVEFTQACSGAIYGKNLQQCLFENIGVHVSHSGTYPSTLGPDFIVSHGFDFDGIAISFIDRCCIQYVSSAITMRYTATSQATGPVSITRANIFWVVNAFSLGLTNFLDISNNYIEGFENGILLTNDNPSGAAFASSVLIDGNVFTQSKPVIAQARMLKVVSAVNTNALRLYGKITNNTAAMATGSAVKPPYAISFELASNISSVDVQCAIEKNWFKSVTTSGVYSDSLKPVIIESDNSTIDDFTTPPGAYLPNFSGTGNNLTQSYVLQQAGTGTSVSSGTSETVLATIRVPARAIGANGTLRVSADWTGTNNANNKWLRVRLGGIGGAELQQGDLANAAQASSVCKIQNRNSASSQIGTATTSKSNNTINYWLATGSINTANDQDLVITGQPTVGGDVITLESFLVEVLP